MEGRASAGAAGEGEPVFVQAGSVDLFGLGVEAGSDDYAPLWSGLFIRLGHEDAESRVGIMLIWRGDLRHHKPPDGWKFTKGQIEPDAEIEALDAELWVLHKEFSYDISPLLRSVGD